MNRVYSLLFLSIAALVFGGGMLAACTAPSHASTPTDSVTSGNQQIQPILTPSNIPMGMSTETVTPAPTKTLEPTVAPEINPVHITASVWEAPTKEQLYEVQQSQDLPAYANEYKQALINKFGQNIRVEFATNNRDRSTLVAYGEDGNIIAAYRKDGKKLDEPIYYGPDENGMMVLDELKSGIELDYRTIPDSADAVVQWTGKNGDLPVLVKDPVTIEGETIYSMYWDNTLNEWRETQAYTELKALLQPEYDTTEFTGIYSVKYYPDRFRTSFTYQDELGTEFTIHLGLASGLPRNAAIPSEKGKKVMADYWLMASYLRYTEMMGNQLSLDEYRQLVNQGGGQAEADFFDEITGEIKHGIMEPTQGSVTLFPTDELPLQANPKTDSFQQPYYITANQDGLIIMVAGFDPDVIEQYNYNIKSKGHNPDFVWSQKIFNRFTDAMWYLGGLSTEKFSTGGMFNIDDMVLFNTYDDREYSPELEGLSAKKNNKFPFMSVQ